MKTLTDLPLDEQRRQKVIRAIKRLNISLSEQEVSDLLKVNYTTPSKKLGCFTITYCFLHRYHGPIVDVELYSEMFGFHRFRIILKEITEIKSEKFN